MTDLRDGPLKATLQAVAERATIPERLMDPSAVVYTAAERQWRARSRVSIAALALLFLFGSAGWAVAAQGWQTWAVEPEATGLAQTAQAPATEAPELDGLTLSLPMPDAPVTGRYGERLHPILKVKQMHTGVDFAAPIGTVVQVAADGTVLSIGSDPDLGNVVVVSHGEVEGAAVSTWYGHVGEITVEVGQKVSRGEAVAQIGLSSNVTGPILHFEVRVDGQPVDPMLWLQP